MSDPTFMADPTRLVIAAIVGIALLLALIIKFKLHPVLSMMVSALAIGIGAGMRRRQEDRPDLHRYLWAGSFQLGAGHYRSGYRHYGVL